MADLHDLDIRIFSIPVSLHAPVPAQNEFQVYDFYGYLVAVHEPAGCFLQHSSVFEGLAWRAISIVLKFS